LSFWIILYFVIEFTHYENFAALIFVFVALPITAIAQTEQQAFFYCLDHPNKVLYRSTGKAVVKTKLEDNEYYQYGFMKRMGWINRDWEGLEYGINFSKQKGSVDLTKQFDSLKQLYRLKGYQIRDVPMPYAMKPFEGYRKDGKN
jgi:hypothetical protein